MLAFDLPFMNAPADGSVQAAMEPLVAVWSQEYFGSAFRGLSVRSSGVRPYSRWMRFCVNVADKHGVTTHELFAKQPQSPALGWQPSTSFDPVRREFDALRDAMLRLGATPACRVPAPLGISADGATLITEAVEGVALDRYLAAAKWWSRSQSMHGAERRFELLGRWLRVYQQTPAGELPQRASWVPLLSQAEQRLQAISEHRNGAFLSSLARDVMRRLSKLADEAGSDVDALRCHGDFGPWNALVKETQDDVCTVVDFYCAQPQARWLDVANVTTYLEYLELSPSLRRRKLIRMSDAFLRGYGTQMPPACPAVRLCCTYQRICRLYDLVHETNCGWLGWRGWQYRLRYWSDRLITALDDEGPDKARKQ